MSLLLNWESAIINPSKLRDYILSLTHPIGRFKAKLFSVWIVLNGEDVPRLVTLVPGGKNR